MVGRNYFNRNNGPSHLRGKSCNVNVQAGRIANADLNTLRMPVGVHTFLISQNVARLCIVQFRIARSAYRPFIIVIGDHEVVWFCFHSRHHQHSRWFSQLISHREPKRTSCFKANIVQLHTRFGFKCENSFGTFELEISDYISQNGM